MNTASKSVVSQEWAKSSGVPLSTLLSKARRIFRSVAVVCQDATAVQLREINGVCEVVCLPDEAAAKRLAAQGLERGADGVVVVAAASLWLALLGS